MGAGPLFPVEATEIAAAEKSATEVYNAHSAEERDSNL